jgi:hypothetical protein
MEAIGFALSSQRSSHFVNERGRRSWGSGKSFYPVWDRRLSWPAKTPGANLVKLRRNFLITAVIESLAESFALVRKAGLDAYGFLEVLTKSLFAAPIYKRA